MTRRLSGLLLSAVMDSRRPRKPANPSRWRNRPAEVAASPWALLELPSADELLAFPSVVMPRSMGPSQGVSRLEVL